MKFRCRFCRHSAQTQPPKNAPVMSRVCSICVLNAALIKPRPCPQKSADKYIRPHSPRVMSCALLTARGIFGDTPLLIEQTLHCCTVQKFPEHPNFKHPSWDISPSKTVLLARLSSHFGSGVMRLYVLSSNGLGFFIQTSSVSIVFHPMKSLGQKCG